MTKLRTVVVAGSPVHFLDEGDGPTVLLLHGSGPGTTGSGAWAATAEALGRSWHFVAPDQAGFGRTPLPLATRGGLQHWTESAADLMDALGVESYAVVGHSMGGAVGLALAASRPRQVTRVVASRRWAPPGHRRRPSWTPPRTAALPLLEHLADVRLHVLGRCGHVPAVEHPHDFRRLLAGFLPHG